ncbi:hypothetical protein [uncultured Erythrobacter sp.]|uniref:hypothetical protein n=1 Tax=uncultured Erythrobacter sp. TaxID=263913 RepID=UPI00261165E7|nr:hypothetical protein [uncultured Erythrobacter sp.]
MTKKFEIGLAGEAAGKRHNAIELAADVRACRKVALEAGSCYLLPETVHGIEEAVLSRTAHVSRTDGDVDGICFHNLIDVTHRRYGSGLIETYRLNELRGLTVLPSERRRETAHRLVRSAQFKGTILSHMKPNAFALRAVATVGAIHRENIAALNLAKRMGAIITPPEGPVVDSSPALRAYSQVIYERVQRMSVPIPFRIAVFRNIDLVEAARLHHMGREEANVFGYGQHTAVAYEPSADLSDWLDTAATSLALSGTNYGIDDQWLSRLGIDDCADTRGEGNIFFGRITREMKYHLAA